MAKSWYVVHTYSGYENKIEKTIRKIMETDLTFNEVVTDIKVPTEEVVEVKDGVKKTVKRKILPSYILVQMELPEYQWEIFCSQIKRIQGVTGFVGSLDGKSRNPLPATSSREFCKRPASSRPIRLCGQSKISVRESKSRSLKVHSRLSPVLLKKSTWRKAVFGC